MSVGHSMSASQEACFLDMKISYNHNGNSNQGILDSNNATLDNINNGIGNGSQSDHVRQQSDFFSEQESSELARIMSSLGATSLAGDPRSFGMSISITEPRSSNAFWKRASKKAHDDRPSSHGRGSVQERTLMGVDNMELQVSVLFAELNLDPDWLVSGRPTYSSVDQRGIKYRVSHWQ